MLQGQASMTKSDIELLFEYDRWANNRVFQAALKLSAEQFTRDLGGSFRSVRDTLAHIVGGEWIWLAYWNDPPSTPGLLEALVSRRNALFSASAAPDIAAVQKKWAEVEKEQLEFVKRLTDEALLKSVPFRTTDVPLMHLMQHMANHSTYHRGQVALMMRQLGAEPIATDYHVFLVEGR